LKHALVAGLVYVFVWEAALAAYLDGVRFLSVRRYALSVVNGLDPERLTDAEVGTRAATIGVVLVLVGFTALAVRRLTRMDVP
jgi:ABC-2 type transport system permease protein